MGAVTVAGVFVSLVVAGLYATGRAEVRRRRVSDEDDHRRYDSDEFDYSGCVVCDSDGDTLGWPCPTMQARQG